MKGFVASWFFPPITTSEALVAYKLLANSEHSYDVCSSSSNQWSYNQKSKLKSDNIEQFIINTDNIDEWVNKSVEIFVKNHKIKNYDFIMTRSMPPESHKVGLIIRELYPKIKWIASFADPVANNPYDMIYIKNNKHYLIKKMYKFAPDFFVRNIVKYYGSGGKLLSSLYKLEKCVFNKANILIFPSEQQCKYSTGKQFELLKSKCLIVPHSFWNKLYPTKKIKDNDKFTIAYIGYADKLRNPENFIRALLLIKNINPNLFSKIKVLFIGIIPIFIKDMVNVFFMQENVIFENGMTYEKSLEIMQNADALLHIDAHFPELIGGSIFFAGKIADYMGTGKPILGLTEKESTAGIILNNTGNITCSNFDIIGIAKSIVKLSNSDSCIKDYEEFSSENVAKNYDEFINRKLGDSYGK